MLVFSWWFFVRVMTESSFFILVSIIQPVIFASIAVYVFRAGGQSGDHTLLYAAFLEDPLTWALLGLAAGLRRTPREPRPEPA